MDTKIITTRRTTLLPGGNAATPHAARRFCAQRGLHADVALPRTTRGTSYRRGLWDSEPAWAQADGDAGNVCPGRYADALKADDRGNLHAVRAYMVNRDFSRFDRPADARRVSFEALSDLMEAEWGNPSGE